MCIILCAYAITVLRALHEPWMYHVSWNVETHPDHRHTCQPPSEKKRDYASKNSGFCVKSRDAACSVCAFQKISTRRKEPRLLTAALLIPDPAPKRGKG